MKAYRERLSYRAPPPPPPPAPPPPPKEVEPPVPDTADEELEWNPPLSNPLDQLFLNPVTPFQYQ